LAAETALRTGRERGCDKIAKITPEFLNRGFFDAACSECAHISRVKHAGSVALVAKPGLVGGLGRGA
jgi:hypothetical protein